MNLKIVTTISLGLLAAACSSTEHRNVSAAYGTGVYQASNQACVDYGFVPNTAAYSRCVTSEQAARNSYRPSPGYAPSLVASDARNACYSYGLSVGTAPYDRCVAREIDARTYRDSAAAPAYRVDANGYRIAGQPAPYYAPAPAYQPAYQPPQEQQTYRDEFGNRYDSQGNRINAQGQIIPMRQSYN